MRFLGFLYNLIASRGILKCSYFGKSFNGEFYDLHNIIKMESLKNEHLIKRNEYYTYLGDGEVSWDIDNDNNDNNDDDDFNYNQTTTDYNRTKVSEKWINYILSTPLFI